MSLFKRQRGAVLIVSLIMLVILTLFVLSAVSLTSGTLKVVGNMQNQMVVESDAQAAIEQVLSVPGNFDIPVPTPAPTTVNYTNVTVSKPVCLDAVPATGYGVTIQLVPEDTYWEVSATANDPVTAAQAEITQGLRIRLTAGNCGS